MSESQASDDQIDEIESLCLNCGRDGRTRMLLTKIPYFKDVVVASFECGECGFSNNELLPTAAYQDKGISISVRVRERRDLDRQVVKSDYSEVSIPEIEFEIKRQNGLITTIEGLLDRSITGLHDTIKLNPGMDQKIIDKMTDVIAKLIECKSLQRSFTFILTDPSGNSYVENYNAPRVDASMDVRYYRRSPEENKLLGLRQEQEDALAGSTDESGLRDEVIQFPATCYNCSAPCFTNMKTTEIPHFDEAILMSTNCNVCGYKNNEIKSGQGIRDRGIRLEIKINSEEDLKRDVVRSDTCSVEIPDVELEMSSNGAGKYTTIEGLVEDIKRDLNRTNPFVDGDSAVPGCRSKINEVIERLKSPLGYTLILDDPCGNSFIEGVEGESYERTFEQNEEFGLNDMKTDPTTS